MSNLQTARNKLKNWLYIEPNINQIKKDIENFRKNPSNKVFQKKYSEIDRNGKHKSNQSMNGTIRRTYNTLLKSKNITDNKRGMDLKAGYDNKQIITNPPPQQPTQPTQKNLWYKFFNHENPQFYNEKIINNPSTKADVGYYYSINTLLSDFVSNGLFYRRKIPILINKLTNFFNGVRYYKTTTNKAVKIILFCEDVQERKFGKTFISIQDFLNNWLNWLHSLRVRFIRNNDSYEVSYTETFLLYMRVSTYMNSTNFLNEKGSRFSLVLNYK